MSAETIIHDSYTSDLPIQVDFLTQEAVDLPVSENYRCFYTLRRTLTLTADPVIDLVPGEIAMLSPGTSCTALQAAGGLTCMLTIQRPFFHACSNYQIPVFFHALSGHAEQKDLDRFSEILQQLIALLRDPSHGQTPRDRKYFACQELIYYFLERFCTFEDMPEPLRKTQQRIDFITDYLRQNYSRPVTQSELAEALEITPQYLSVFIHRQMHSSFQKQLADIRFSHVCRELTETDLTITQITFGSGFSGTTSFNRQFKERYQMTPLSYRRQNKKAASAEDASRTEDVYAEYCDALKVLKQKNKSFLQLTTDSRKTTFFSNPGGRVMNIPNAADCLNAFYIRQIRQILTDISFRCVRLSRLLDPDVLAVMPDDRKNPASFQMDYGKCDAILHILMMEQQSFLLVLDPDAFNHTGVPFQEVFKHFLSHCILRYGRSVVGSWKIEFCCTDFGSSAQYTKKVLPLFRVIQELNLELSVGGPLFLPELAPYLLTDTLNHLERSGIRFDFLTIKAYPYMEDGSISLNPDILIYRLRRLKTALAESGYGTLPLWIVDFGFYDRKPNYIHDDVFTGCFYVYNAILLSEAADALIWPCITTLPEAAPSDNRVFFGERGLLWQYAIYKPAFFALRYFTITGSHCLHRGQNHLITLNENGEYLMLLCNYRHPAAAYCRYPDQEVTVDNIYTFFTSTEVLNYDITIRHPEHPVYQATSFSMNPDSNMNNFLKHWIRSGPLRRFSPATLQVFRNAFGPETTFHEAAADPDLRFTGTLSPNEFRMFFIIPVD